MLSVNGLHFLPQGEGCAGAYSGTGPKPPCPAPELATGSLRDLGHPGRGGFINNLYNNL